MNIQIEHQDDHTTRITVEVAPERVQRAKQQAASNLSKRVNIPGFRKGKAPYNVMLRYVGEATITENAIDLITQDVYREALIESGVDPYGPGSLMDVSLDPAVSMIFSVPRRPEVTLGDYRSVRLDFQKPEISEADLDAAMADLRRTRATYQESTQPVQAGDRVTVDIHAEEVRAAEAGQSDEQPEPEAETHDHDHDHDHDPDDGLARLHAHDEMLLLTPEAEQFPGFNEALLGAASGEDREFDLNIPDDADVYDEYAGKHMHFRVTVKKVENVLLPELDDAFVQSLEPVEGGPTTMPELREFTRKGMEEMSLSRYRADYERRAVDAMVSQSAVRYPEAALVDEMDNLIHKFSHDLERQGLNLEDYFKITRTTRQDLYQSFRPNAEVRLRRMLVMSEIARVENLGVDEVAIEETINEMLQSAAEDQRDAMRQILMSDSMQAGLRNQVLSDALSKRIIDIAQGIAAPLPPDSEVNEPAAEAASAAAESSTEANSEEGEAS